MSLAIQSSASEVSLSPVIVNPIGKKSADRVTSVLQGSSGISALALITQKGAIGKVAREHAGQAGMVNIVRAAASGNYRPLVEYVAILTNSAVLVRTRAEYEALPTMLDIQILNAESKATPSGAKLAAKLSVIKAELVQIMAATAERVAKRQAEAAARIETEGESV